MDVQFHGLTFRLPPDWCDVTDGDLPTLAKPDGVGAIQFSVARYQSGAGPKVGHAALQSLLERFCSSHGFDCDPQVDSHGHIQVVKSRNTANGELVAIWYASNGIDIVLATYVSQQAGTHKTADELKDAEALIASLRF